MPQPDKPRALNRHRLGDMLVLAGKITREQLEEAIQVQSDQGTRLGSTLVALGYIDEPVLSRFLSTQQGVEAVQGEELVVQPAAEALLPQEFIVRFEVIPLAVRKRTLIVATATPMNLALMDEVRFVTGFYDIEAVLVPEVTLRRTIEERYASQTMLEDVLHSGGFFEEALKTEPGEEAEDERHDVYQLTVEAEQQPVITLANFLLIDAVRRKASDIHIEPYEGFLRVRMRIDGILHSVLTPPHRMHRALVSRIKILGAMDISNTRAPQDGHIAVEYMGEVIHARVNALPTVYGEKVVIRLMKKEASLLKLESLGIPEPELSQLKTECEYPQGLVLVTGPTGSGKTTTVHSCLNFVNDVETNVVTVEDPFEAAVPGVNHVQIDRKSGLTFLAAIRAILRQDPDVVFVGEIRDREVANTALEAAMTGHMVMSTLHTNSAVETIVRLHEMGVEGFLVAGTLRAVVAQRLTRRVCPDCATRDDSEREEVAKFSTPQEMEAATLKRGAGCNACMSTGYRGRAGAYEVLIVNDELRDLISAGARSNELEKCARRHGTRSMFQHGMDLVRSGVTTLAELRRAVPS